MAEEKKKKGFWSWLGFGKKASQEQQTEQNKLEEQPSQAVETTALSEERPVERAETATPPTDEALQIIEPNAPLVEIEDTKAEEVEPQPADEVLPEIEPNAPLVEVEETKSAEVVESYSDKPAQEGGFFSRLIKGLIKTKQNIGSGFLNLFRGKKIDDELFEELEEQLLVADLGMPTTTKIINNLTQHASKKQLQDAELLYQQLKQELAEVLKPVAQPLVLSEKKPYVILMVGVNGVGKTTTIGKLARKFQAEGKSVMLAAGDTFRAAAVEQLQVWGERNHIPVVAQSTGADSASVIFDAMQSAAAKGVDVLIADTAGRLQNKQNLMDELKKIVRVMKKYDDTAPHEIMLTLDAGTGQNAISQAKLFNEAVGLTGITLTKLDGTAKGGVIFAIADQFNIPIRYIGVGEKIEDLRPFDADEFIEALFDHEGEK
ncbi:signal recognition particle-docking protein FtsY [Muribacter muris]|uniref:Signal recognition particle receptor FtsY n=1 Tax=Muribacter muris TaxID=67855 RepID=A0A4Y9JSE8_9PAST|nr:signal recognition particle-docking protein FtsY [Muribacter muris]MBF0785953.1 signal recognition particle-docking protein FtsY [Muribacter muris]MBF0826106.1 signal recognition particle-docking protein FtsY [Muribacter muris]TFV08242.1 signal recognition particle-docking protein FtsY [Muribacter muris]